MPNWADADVTVVGTEAHIRAFTRRFTCEDEEHYPKGFNKVFARCYISQPRAELDQDLKALFWGKRCGRELRFQFHVYFAWSAYACMMSGYPQEKPDKFTTIEDACTEDQVSVEISTLELGRFFAEHLCCIPGGKAMHKVAGVSYCQCPKCKEDDYITGFEEFRNHRCPFCGHIGVESVKEGKARGA